MNEEGFGTITALLAGGQVTNNGYHLQNFERLLAEYLGVGETVAVSSGSDALLLALKALSLPRGKVVLPAYTYIATLNAVVHAGLDPVFCDIDAGSFTMDPKHLAELIQRNPDVRCVLPVNVFGVAADLVTIRKLCDEVGAKLLYDNAHGFGTEVAGRRIPSEIEVQIFSFHATKTLRAVEGGLIVWEGFGFPVLEAFATGTPLITSRTTSLPEVSGGACLLVDPYSVEDIGTAMCSLHLDHRLREQLICKGLARAAAFSWDRTARQTLDAYRMLAANTKESQRESPIQ